MDSKNLVSVNLTLPEKYFSRQQITLTSTALMPGVSPNFTSTPYPSNEHEFENVPSDTGRPGHDQSQKYNPRQQKQYSQEQDKVRFIGQGVCA